ncbi:hypothetical protein PASE110613_14215 [Paenibacillus sediminis]|uniref:Uncharacterized protein YxeA n=1 Tax=Paenibacillus sediminis TaxID=664909 RepID=A0ABS4H7A3_9BACL|nr:hypothetical protein [Paenibacillus sediminis]MBP1937945.1 uncharacterized protein YxeA [Paenibacillus sediminis]
MDTQVWLQFLEKNWLVIIIALVVLFMILGFIKTVVKWALVAVIVIGLIVYSGISLDQLNNVVSTVKDEAIDTVKTQALNAMKDEAKEAKFTQNPDGTFTIKSTNLEMTGKTGENKVRVTYRGVSLGEWKMNDTIDAFIKEATP